ncbi:MAG: 16S rRNA (uracil(1498)-N(3))-methyltransferase [Oscillospiraceae bacterium]|nr:16S rRNA (uracil(1498)-N(3))-methyltransferase [Oscillospiraceae bacterium]
MPRFFIAASNIFGGIAYINSRDAEHIRALRIRQGETFTVCDGSGNDYSCVLTKINDDGAEAQILEKTTSDGEASVYCTVFAAFSKGDRMETAVQKCVELGAAHIVLFPSARCVSRPDEKSLVKKTARLQLIAEEAAKQSGRGLIPSVTSVGSFEAAVKLAAAADLPIFCYEDERELPIRKAIESRPDAKTVSIVTGPEGGFEPAEAQYAAQAGMLSVTMGPRILRCETAPICALAAVMLLTDNL